MKNPLRLLSRFIVSLCALFAVGCIDVQQDIWINADGSGRAVVDIGISKQAESMMSGAIEGITSELGGDGESSGNPFDMDLEKEKAKIEADPRVTRADVKKTTDDKYTHFIYDMDVTDITQIDKILEDVMSDGPLSAGGDDSPAPEAEFKIEKLDNGNFQLTAKMEGEAPPEEAGEAGGAAMAAMMAQMLGDAAFTFRVHAPAVSHDGKEVDEAIVWSIPLADLASGKSLSAAAEFKPGGSGGGAAGGGISPVWIALGAIILVGLILFFILQAQKPKLA